MDPTKNFDHLDPKLKETYARVMGTTTPAGAQDVAAQPAAAPPPQPVTPSYPPAQPVTPAPFPSQMGPNPGTGPTVSSIPQETSTLVPPMQQAQPDPNAGAPAGSSFFSNPSPATAAPTQNPVSPVGDMNQNAQFQQAAADQAPINPYAPDPQAQNPMPADQMGQPYAATTGAVQKGPRETSALLRVLYIIGGVIFFAIYTIFWIKVFNLPFFF